MEYCLCIRTAKYNKASQAARKMLFSSIIITIILSYAIIRISLKLRGWQNLTLFLNMPYSQYLETYWPHQNLLIISQTNSLILPTIFNISLLSFMLDGSLRDIGYRVFLTEIERFSTTFFNYSH